MQNIFLFHGKGGSPNGSVSLLERELAPRFPDAAFCRPKLLHSDPAVLAEHSLARLPELSLPQSAIVIGISLGGLVAARFQEAFREDLSVICVSSPTWADGVRVQRRMPRRIAIYSSKDEVIAGRTTDWPSLADAYDIPTLTHDTDQHLELLTRLISAYLNKEDLKTLLP